MDAEQYVAAVIAAMPSSMMNPTNSWNMAASTTSINSLAGRCLVDRIIIDDSDQCSYYRIVKHVECTYYAKMVWYVIRNPG